MTRRELGVLCASGSMALTPFHDESFWDGVRRGPGAICADAGSSDIGPYYLGADGPYNPREWEKHDLGTMLRAARQLHVPMIVGSAGGAGTDRAVNLYAEIVQEVAVEEGLEPFRMALIYSELDLDDLRQRAARQEVPGLGIEHPLGPADLDATDRAVAMMGVEPLVEALRNGADVIIAGRSCDDAVFAAVPVKEGYDKGLALHMGKCIECGPLVATPILSRETVVAWMREDHFLVEPMHPGQCCTPASVAGHSLYERADPRFQAGPGGTLDLTSAMFEPYTDRVCKVQGSRWVPDDRYTVKVEGAGFVGYRATLIFGLRDPLSVKNVDHILEGIRDEVRRIYPNEREGSDYHLVFHVYGRNAVMKELEPVRNATPHELGIVGEVVARTQDLAINVAKLAKYTAFRVHYPGKIGTAGGAALLADEVLRPDHPQYQWTIEHILPVTDPSEVFRTTFVDVCRPATVLA